MTLVDTPTACRVLGLRPRAAREAIARVAARTQAVYVAAGVGRRARAVSIEDFAAHYGLDIADVRAAAGQP